MTSIPHDLSTPLRSVTQRITATPFKQLPYIAPYLATTIAEHGKRLFEFPKESLNGDRSDITVLVHKFKTQLSALLQDKSPEARYGSVVLIKATIEVGGWNILQSSGPWVRGLISILGVSSTVHFAHQLQCEKFPPMAFHVVYLKSLFTAFNPPLTAVNISDAWNRDPTLQVSRRFA